MAHNTSNNISSALDDSWHTNSPQTLSSSSPTAAPMSWFRPWNSSITSSTVSMSTPDITNNKTTTASHISTHETLITSPSSNPCDNDILPRSPSSFNMLRGAESHESEDRVPSHSMSDGKTNHNLSKQKSFSDRIKNIIGSNATANSCMPANGSMPNNTETNEGDDDLYSIIADVPFFPPEHKENQNNVQLHKQSSYREEELVVEFPSRQENNQQPSLPAQIDSKPTTNLSQDHCTRKQVTTEKTIACENIVHEESRETFPGFALYTMARVYYVLGQYTKALDTTTECLAFQKKVLLINGNSVGNVFTNNDLQASSGGLGGSVRNFLKGSGGNMTNGTRTTTVSSSLSPNAHQPIVIASSTAKLLSDYPTHECVAQTLLLRGRVLAVCGLYGSDDIEENSSPSKDLTLVHQAIQHVEMALAIQRKISTFTNVNINLTQWELAVPMILLGILKCEICNFQEAQAAYEDALLVLKSVRQLHDAEHTTAKGREDSEMAQKHYKISRQITKEMANVFYFKGVSYQKRKLHSDAFEAYNKGLDLFRRSGATKYHTGEKRIICCMKKYSALEKLLSDFLDDPNRV